jgi:SMODS-associating 4TM effector domain
VSSSAETGDVPESPAVQEAERLTAWQEQLIAAYSQRYREAARWKLAVWSLDAALFLAGLVVWTVWGSRPVLGIMSAAYLLLARVVLRPELSRAHAEAVKLQEQFEVSLFRLSWNEGLMGTEMGAGDVADLSRRFRGDPTELHTWFVVSPDVPHEVRVLLCQWQNASWGRKDHARFARTVIALIALSIATTLAFGILQDATLTDYLTTLAMPSLPWLLDLADLSALHRRASARRSEIEQRVNALLNGASSTNVPTTETLRAIQDTIARNRSDAGRIPAWFYRLLRRRNFEAHRIAVRHLVEEWR